MSCPHSKSFDPEKCPLCLLYAKSPDYREAMQAAGMPIGGLPLVESPGEPPSLHEASIEPQIAIEGPGILQKAWNASKAVGKAVGRMVRGKKVLTPPEVVAERRKICDACHMLDVVRDECAHPACGCKLSARLTVGLKVPGKLEVASESCPLEPPKWKPLQG